MVQPHRKTDWQLLIKLNINLLNDSAILLIYLHRENLCPYKDLDTDISNIFTHNSQKHETT